MDLVALANIKGEVALHRLTWTKAWVLNPPKDVKAQTVKGISWRPDGKVLAVAYSNGTVLLINIETKAIVLSFKVNDEISFLSWVQEKTDVKQQDVFNLNEVESELLKSIDLSKPYLRDPPPVSPLEDSINFEDIKGLTSFLQEQAEFNLLVIGTKEGLVHLRVFGCWKCLSLKVSDYFGYQCSIKNVHFTEDLSKMFITVEDKENVTTVLFNSEIFKTHSTELYHVTMKYIKLYELVLYLSKIITNITETWESILLQFDQKLSKYASQVPEGGVTADFLELLMFGTFTEQMEEFLMHDLTKKGLEKFGQTMEFSYSNIQSYLIKHIIKYAQNGTYYLAELKGMSQFEERYGVIGLNTDEIQQAIRSNGAFIIKAGEMQQIINHSVINYKAFFRWLYGSILRLMDEHVPSEVQKMTQQDLSCIAEFLQHFDNYGKVGNKKGSTFIMERIRQYMVDDDLTIKPDMTGNEWTQFLEENNCLKSNENVLCHYLDKSLVQVFNEMKRSVEKVFETPVQKISEKVQPVNTFCSLKLQPMIARVSSINISKDILLMALQKSPKSLYFFQINIDNSCQCLVRCGNIFFTKSPFQECEFDEILNIIDVKFYSTSILSLLLQEGPNSDRAVLLQLPMSPVLQQLAEVDIYAGINESFVPDINGSSIEQKVFRNVDMPVAEFSVSGSRRVSIVLGENRRKIKLFEMESEEDEEEDAEMTSMIKDDSMQDNFSNVSVE